MRPLQLLRAASRLLISAAVLGAVGCGSDLSRPAFRPYAATAIHSYGDSITCGAGLPDGVCPGGDPRTMPSPFAYPAVIASDRGLQVSNRGVSGDSACDLWPRQIAPGGDPIAPSSRTLYTLQIGTNDAGQHAPGSYERIFDLCDGAAMAWLALSPSAKVLAGDPGIVTTGAVLYQSDAIGQVGLLSTGAMGATIAVPLHLAASGPVYVFYLIQDGNAGRWTWTVGDRKGDGTTATEGLLETGNKTRLSMALLRIATVPAGPQTLRFTQTNAGAGEFGLWAVGAPSMAADDLPPLVVGNIPLVRNNDYLQRTVRSYNADLSATVRQLQKDGLDIRAADSHPLMKAGAAEMLDSLHPNVLGQRELATAFEQVF